MKSNFIALQNEEKPYIKYPLRLKEEKVIMEIRSLLQRNFPRFICDISVFYNTDEISN